MAWVRFADGSRRKVSRVNKADAEADLNTLLGLRAAEETPPPRRQRLMTFGEVIDAWFEAGAPNVSPNGRSRRARRKSPNTIANACKLLDTHIRPNLGQLRVDRTTTKRVEQPFMAMAERGLATSTIDHAWLYLNHACHWSLREGKIKTNPVENAILPEARPTKGRKSLTIEQAQRLLTDATGMRTSFNARWREGPSLFPHGGVAILGN